MIIIVYSDAKIVNFRQTSSVNHIKKRDDAVFYLISVPKCHLRLSFLFLFRLTCIIRSFGLTKTKKLHAGMPVPFRFNSLQSLTRSSGIGLQNCKALREVRESVCKIAKARAKFGNRFAKNAKLARSSGIGLQNCKGLREVRESLCKIAEACAKFGNRFAKLQRLPRSSGIVLQKLQGFPEVRESFCIYFLFNKHGNPPAQKKITPATYGRSGGYCLTF